MINVQRCHNPSDAPYPLPTPMTTVSSTRVNMLQSAGFQSMQNSKLVFQSPDPNLPPLQLDFGTVMLKLSEQLSTPTFTPQIQLVDASAVQAVGGPSRGKWELVITMLPADIDACADRVANCLQQLLAQQYATVMPQGTQLPADLLAAYRYRAHSIPLYGWKFELGGRLSIEIVTDVIATQLEVGQKRGYVSVVNGITWCSTAGYGSETPDLTEWIQHSADRCFDGTDLSNIVMPMVEAMGDGCVFKPDDWTKAQNQLANSDFGHLTQSWRRLINRDPAAQDGPAARLRMQVVHLLNLLLIAHGNPVACERVALLWLCSQKSKDYVGINHWVEMIQRNAAVTPDWLAWIHGVVFHDWATRNDSSASTMWTFGFTRQTRPRPIAEFQCGQEKRYLRLSGPSPDVVVIGPEQLAARLTKAAQAMQASHQDLSIFLPIFQALGMMSTPTSVVDVLQELSVAWGKAKIQGLLTSDFPQITDRSRHPLLDCLQQLERPSVEVVAEQVNAVVDSELLGSLETKTAPSSVDEAAAAIAQKKADRKARKQAAKEQAALAAMPPPAVEETSKPVLEVDASLPPVKKLTKAEKRALRKPATIHTTAVAAVVEAVQPVITGVSSERVLATPSSPLRVKVISPKADMAQLDLEPQDSAPQSPVNEPIYEMKTAGPDEPETDSEVDDTTAFYQVISLLDPDKDFPKENPKDILQLVQWLIDPSESLTDADRGKLKTILHKLTGVSAALMKDATAETIRDALVNFRCALPIYRKVDENGCRKLVLHLFDKALTHPDGATEITKPVFDLMHRVDKAKLFKIQNPFSVQLSQWLAALAFQLPLHDRPKQIDQWLTAWLSQHAKSGPMEAIAFFNPVCQYAVHGLQRLICHAPEERCCVSDMWKTMVSIMPPEIAVSSTRSLIDVLQALPFYAALDMNDGEDQSTVLYQLMSSNPPKWLTDDMMVPKPLIAPLITSLNTAEKQALASKNAVQLIAERMPALFEIYQQQIKRLSEKAVIKMSKTLLDDTIAQLTDLWTLVLGAKFATRQTKRLRGM